MILIDKEIKFKRTPLDLPILVFLLVAILSAVFSVDKNSSIFGFYGRFSDGLVGLLSLGMLYFLITNNVTANGDKKTETSSKSEIRSVFLSKLFLGSVFLAIAVTYLTLFGIWTKLSNFQFSLTDIQIKIPVLMQQPTFNPASGSLEGLAVFLAITVNFLVGLVVVGEKKKLTNIANWILIFLSLGLLIIINYTAAWIVILASSLIFTAIALIKRMFKKDAKKLLLSLILIVTAAVFIFVDNSSLQNSILKYQLPREQILDQPTSFLIGFKGAVENLKSGFLGSGIGTWHYDFSKFKPAEFNQSVLWQIRFDRSGNHFAEILATTGFLGFLAYFFLVGIFLMISYLFLRQNRGGLALFLGFVALLVSQFVYYQNTVLGFLFWMMLALAVVNWKGPIKEKIISLKDFPELSLIFSVLLTVSAIAVLGTYFFAAKFYLADINYRNYFSGGADSIQELEKAVSLNSYQAQYKIVLARDYLSQAIAEGQKPSDQINQIALLNNINLAIHNITGEQVGENYIKGAAELSSNRVAVWETAGMIYSSIQGLATGTVTWGIDSFEKAVVLEPTNPVLHTELGKLYLAAGDKEKAKNEFSKALELKPDYGDAIVQKALMSEADNNLEEAIKEMESLAKIYPSNSEVFFQIGRLYFNNNQTDEAISYFEAAVSLMPNHSNAHYSLGVAYQKIGETAKAIAEFEKVLELNPGNEDVRQKLEDLRK
ncbi:MAG: hypothetical protein A2175_00160 [Candidatus Nealsonbacteria bacterium RBG_13_42_11]|uniref:Uncharacterized protein n=1 Tax=Candidatus Nealsonbacteria bacterium RBG_13_42_11 TaxID=1801663 RepID=A0A1G2DYV5_9BACT|nr:MAG: hypothetical protein A2175_00160 [Candidatus Nealsonbacteria bacterium RBG_13_42_11]